MQNNNIYQETEFEPNHSDEKNFPWNISICSSPPHVVLFFVDFLFSRSFRFFNATRRPWRCERASNTSKSTTPLESLVPVGHRSPFSQALQSTTATLQTREVNRGFNSTKFFRWRPASDFCSSSNLVRIGAVDGIKQGFWQLETERTALPLTDFGDHEAALGHLTF